ncbi:ABC transporter substrate-binding protein [Thalassospira profundimaris]|uniref:ABC transporter substrate-binding protein n=1 Tax=Thalassospira profundimaris TaxID=502049 RepID=A0A367XDY6_9PROT|nr:extracellular solute-binding protein [Thalassospira profundimaris]RCK51669.1 ABC transporter substrate-binding protein [Thalassospira profundimaris]
MKIKNVLKGAVFGIFAVSGAAHAAHVTLNALFMAQAAYSEDDIRNMTADFKAANPGIDVNVELVPYEALHDKIVLSQSANGYDVVLYDVIWPAEFAQYNLLEDVTNRIDEKTREAVLKGAWTTVEYDGKYYGMPWIADTKFLFYNKDMLKKAGFDTPPTTWEELAAQAKAIKDKGIVDYPLVWSWSQSEAAICDYTTILSAMGGKFLDADGKPAFNEGGGLKALQYMVGTLDDGITNPNSREYAEEDVRRVFSSGQAAFALNWGYMYNLANDPAESQVAGHVGIVPAPGEAGISQASAVNGSMGLGIPSKSTHKEEAWKYIKFLTSEKVQNKYARLSLPIWKASYSDPDVIKGQEPFVNAAKTSLAVMAPRPTMAAYQEASAVLQEALQNAMLGTSTPADALDEAAKTIADMQ